MYSQGLGCTGYGIIVTLTLLLAEFVYSVQKFGTKAVTFRHKIIVPVSMSL